MNKYRKLLNNSIIFFIGNFGSKVLSFLLVRFYTHCLSPSEYGTIDLIVSTLGFVVPIITLCITEAVLRFSIDDNEDWGKIFSVGIAVVVLGNLIFLLSVPIFNSIGVYRGYLLHLYALTLTNSFYQMSAHFTRGCGNSKIFAISGLLHSFTQIGLNILFLLIFKWGINGYLIASISSNIITTLFILLAGKTFKNLKLSFEKKYFNNMLRYSIPLIPNRIFWWIMTSSDRYVILYMLGTGANGLYTVANKIPSILAGISGIFFNAWQLSSVEEAESENKDQFFSKTLQLVSLTILCFISFIMVVLRPLYSIWVDSSFYNGWQCAPLLILSFFFDCMSTYLGTNYIAMKKTNGIFLTTLLGAVVNLILNIVLTPIIGIKGTALATLISFVITWIIRQIDTRQFVKIHYDTRTFVFPLIIVCIQTALLSFNITNIYFQIICFIINVMLCGQYVIQIIKKIIWNKN